LLITIPGGLVGFLAAFCLTRVSILLPFVPVSARPHVSWTVSLAAMSLVVVVGLAAGIAAARRASAVAPAAALRTALAE
jgi:ABC-type antimicrobial peptide transport system permease subunit